jgi:alpha-beta hydrolase superfamily lysophospholipase
VKLVIHRFAATGRPTSAAVLLHAMMADSRYQWRFARWLAAHGVDTFALDFRGHGASRPPGVRDGWRFADYVEHDLPTAIDCVRSLAPHPVTVVGHSLGGLVACATTPRLANGVSRLVLVATAVWRRGDATGARRLYEESRIALLSVLARFGIPMRGRWLGIGSADEPPTWPADLARWYRTRTWDYDATLGGMDVPVDSLCGDRDPYCNPSQAKDFLDRAGSGPKRLTIMTGVDHFGFYRSEGGWGEVFGS